MDAVIMRCVETLSDSNVLKFCFRRKRISRFLSLLSLIATYGVSVAEHHFIAMPLQTCALKLGALSEIPCNVFVSSRCVLVCVSRSQLTSFEYHEDCYFSYVLNNKSNENQSSTNPKTNNTI